MLLHPSRGLVEKTTHRLPPSPASIAAIGAAVPGGFASRSALA
jgi:hypothetical protein